MKDILWRLIGGKESTIPSRFLRILLLALCIHFIAHSLTGIFKQEVGSLMVNVPGAILFLSLYLYLYFTGKENIIKILCFITACALLPLSWLVNDGTIGATSAFFLFSSFAFVAFTPGRLHVPVVVILMTLYLGLFIGEQLHPEWIKPYVTKEAHVKDVFYCTLFITIAICLIFSLMMKHLEYQNQVLAEKVIEQKQLTEKLEVQYNSQIELNQALDSFVYRSSHDLRSPLTSALGLIDITLQAESKEDINRYLNLQKKSLKKLDTFITDILYYSQNRHKEILLEKISLDSLISESLFQLKHLPSYDRIQFSQNEVSHAYIIGDRLRLRIIFNNIISNAYKYFDPHKQQSILKISTKYTPEGISICFEDNGLGINEKHLAQIYDMFFRATHKAEGSGIGLFIVKEAVEKMQGSIHCTSTLGQGTVFEIVLPVLTLS